MKEAFLYTSLPDGKTACYTCPHFCVIEQDKTGICKVRKNVKGKLYSLVYGKACALHIDPIEKKPFYHFLPGTKSLSFATVGCNLKCWNCQNWEISQGPEVKRTIEGEDMPPEKIVGLAQQEKTPSISYTYTEPTVFVEYARDTMKLARKKGLKNVWVSNGFMSPQTFELIAPYLDAINIDLKSFDDRFYQEYCEARLQPVLDTLKRVKEEGIWLEVTTLAIPMLSDSEEMFKSIANFIATDLDKETPWHISKFSGAISWKLQNFPSTSEKTLRQAWEIGKDAGLKYVYTGNIPGLETEDTYCPSCNAKVIDRSGWKPITRYDEEGKCSKCDTPLDLVLK